VLFPCVHIEGGLLPGDLLEEIANGECKGQSSADFGLPRSLPLPDEIAAAWAEARDLWQAFQRRREQLPKGDPATTLTRERWLLPLLRRLGYGEIRFVRSLSVGQRNYPISHQAGSEEDSPPLHLVGCGVSLDHRSPGRRQSPHALLQGFLNDSEHLWGLLSNGLRLRLLRDSTRLGHLAYIEFDLEQIFAGENLADFGLLYRLAHRSRLPQNIEDASECWLERYYQRGIEEGSRARDRLRDGVEQALLQLGQGFLRHPANEELREKVRQGSLSPEEYYRQLLRLVYRLLFLMVSEERGLVGPTEGRLAEIYRRYYSIERLRRLAEGYLTTGERHSDLWQGLLQTFRLYEDDTIARRLGMQALDGDLFGPTALPDLQQAALYNADLLRALRHLSLFREGGGPLRRVNYAALGVEELGSVYESLLDFQPVYGESSSGWPTFQLISGSERKSTGSYYTRPELVRELVQSALEPVISAKLRQARSKEAKIAALLSIRVCDPASGSGHFLLAAARRLGQELARLRTGEENPSPEAFRQAVREVIRQCIYGVDKNPLAVDLCKVALWLEGHHRGVPLTFLDQHIRCGDSLVGVHDLAVLQEGIPDEAYKPVAGDDKAVARGLRQRNQQERASQLTLEEGSLELEEDVKQLAEELRALSGLEERSAEDVRTKAELFEQLHGPGSNYWELYTACNLWTAAFFLPFTPGSPVPTTATLRRYLSRPQAAHGQLVGATNGLAAELRFFHWPLEFPEVFTQGGFDVILCNPPWERIKLQEKEFFAARAPHIAQASNRAARQRLIAKLPETDPTLWEAYQEAKHYAEALSRFLRGSGHFALTAHGDINTYSVFAELFTYLLAPQGQAGIIVPTGIATDATNTRFFAHLVESGRLVSLYDFENREGLFPAVHRSYKFSLLTLRGAPPPRPQPMDFAFYLTRVEQLRDGRRRFRLSARDLAQINPNTRTLPLFRTRQDAALTRAIYQRVGVLWNERRGENPWEVRFQLMFMMNTDSHLFRTRSELEAAGYRLLGNRFLRGGELWLPLYEGKMIWHYDHRYSTFAGVQGRSNTHLPEFDAAAHADPAALPLPWYWVPAEEVEARLGAWPHGWLLGFRDITNSTNERTAIFSLLPRAGVGNKIPLWFFEEPHLALLSCLIANTCSLPFDYFTKQKLAGTTMNFFYVKQFPVLPPTAYGEEELLFIVPRVLELVYTAWDLKPFADILWEEAPAPLRAALQAQWQANAQASGGHPWEPPAWLAAAYPEVSLDPGKGFPHPPFRWDEARRALLQAELDAYYARLYGLSRKQLRYILDPADLTPAELEEILDPWEEVADPLAPAGYAQRAAESDFAGESFRVLKKNELKRYGEYRTRRLVLEAWERLKGPLGQAGGAGKPREEGKGGEKRPKGRAILQRAKGGQ